MKLRATEISGLFLIEPDVFGDSRGWFTETYSKIKLEEQGLDLDFIQDNHSLSAQRGTLRGLHFQKDPKAQTKLVRCTRGRILDVAVDLRKGSPTYKKWVAAELSEENKNQLLIPKGFAHGFLTLTDNAEVQYKVDEYYSPENDRSIRYDDPEIGINWGGIEPILSEKDRRAPLLKDSDVDFSLKVLVTGAEGQLGIDVVRKLKESKLNVLSADRCTFDITSQGETQEYLFKEKPDVIIHCAAYTAVDKAEDEKELCHAVNCDGTKNIAEAAEKIGAVLVYISTDYVFDGEGTEPVIESAATRPVNHYGYTKALGEDLVSRLVKKHFIVRTSWLYGSKGPNFVYTMLRLADTADEIKVVEDQIGSPTYTADLAQFIADLIQTDKYGVYHGVSEGYCSWFDFARAIIEKSGKATTVTAISTEDYPTRARRPKNSRLSRENTARAGLARLPEWKDALDRFLNSLK